jgi:hypothetical protein
MKIGLVTFASHYSERIKDKMELEFDGHPLIEFQLLKMAKAARMCGVGVSLCTDPNYEPFRRAAEFARVPVVAMSDEALRAEDYHLIYEKPLVQQLQDLYDLVVQVNICFPFITVEDFCDWIELAKSHRKPLRPCFQFRDFFYDENFIRADGNTRSQNTKRNNIFYMQGHQFLFVYANDMGTMVHTGGEPRVFDLKPRWKIDLDTYSDVELVRAAWDGGLADMRNVVRGLYEEHSNSRQCTD